MCRILAIFLFLAMSVSFSSFASTLEEIGKKGFIKVGFRPASIPFSYLDKETGRHVGFSVDMAELLADNLSRRFDKKIKIIPVNIKSNERIGAVTSGKIDIEMGSTTYTALRDENVDFSLIFFISETTFIAKKSSGVTSLADLADKRLGSARGTSTLEQILSFVGKGFFKEENLYRFDSLSSGMKAVREGEIDAFATDRSLLEGLKSAEPDPENWIVLDTAIGYDPYAFMLSENQSDFRDFINNSIRWSVQTGEFYRIYDKWMGENGVTPLKMSPALKEYLNVIAIPMSPNWYKR